MNEPPASPTFYVTTAIPYVNAAPHIGFAMELVVADVLARYHRLRGRDVRFQTGSDENSLKNVLAAEAEGITVQALVDRNAGAFRSLRQPLDLSFDDFIRTSVEPGHRRGVEKLWRACAGQGDVYRRSYRGLYCVGCEQFYAEADLHDGRCPEHDTTPELVEEDNWFFRLSRHQARITALLESGELQVVPERYRNEMLAFVRGGLQDFSISRSHRRARGWGITVPDDPDQVMYVWFDALGNYITALDYDSDGASYHRFWVDGAERVHVIGKGITRFHAVYWPAMLLSAGLRLPSTIAVHGYLTVDGKKIGKSLGNAIDPVAIVERFGTDAVRYVLCRHVRSGQDGDISMDRFAAIRSAELADQLGNLLHRTVAMIERYYDGRVPAPVVGYANPELAEAAVRVREDVEAAFASFRHDEALAAAWRLIERANKYAVERAPWTLARRRSDADVEAALATTLWELAESLRLAAVLLAPFVPATAVKIHATLGIPAVVGTWEATTSWGGSVPGTRVVASAPLFPKA